MTDDQLLQALQSQNLLDAAGVNRLKRDTLIDDEPLESIIWKKRLIDDAKVAQVKSALLKVPYRQVDSKTIDAKLLQIYEGTSQIQRMVIARDMVREMAG